MKLRVLFIVAALLLCVITQAQVSKESFEKAVDLVNCKAVELTLKNGDLKKYQDQCHCGKANFTQISQFLAPTKIENTIALSKEIEKLKDEFRDKWTKEYIIKFLSEDIFTDKKRFQKISAFAIKPRDTDFGIFKANLKKKLEATLEENAPPNGIEPDNVQTNNIQPGNTDTTASITQFDELKNRVANLEEVNLDKGWFSGITSQMIAIALLASLLFTILTLYISWKLFNRDENEIPKEIKGYVNSKIDEAGNKNTPNYNPSDLRDANNRIRDLESQVEILKNKVNTSFVSTPVREQFLEVPQPERTETFFLSTPNSDGSFNESSASSTYKEGATIYRFSKIGNNKAKFQIDEKEASMKLALQYPDKNIDPVCEAENAFNPKARRISTVQYGEAELVGDKWIKNKKARIRYEN